MVMITPQLHMGQSYDAIRLPGSIVSDPRVWVIDVVRLIFFFLGIDLDIWKRILSDYK